MNNTVEREKRSSSGRVDEDRARLDGDKKEGICSRNHKKEDTGGVNNQT